MRSIFKQRKKLTNCSYFTTKDNIKVTQKEEINEELKNFKQKHWLSTYIYMSTVPAVKHSKLALPFLNRHNFFT